jgi:hypothetical protein
MGVAASTLAILGIVAGTAGIVNPVHARKWGLRDFGVDF